MTEYFAFLQQKIIKQILLDLQETIKSAQRKYLRPLIYDLVSML